METEKKNNKILWIILGGGAILVMGICLVVAGIILLPRLFGGGDPISSQVPADTEMYISIDLLKLQSEEVGELMDVFMDVADEDEDYQDSIDEELGYYDLSIEEDIVPWIGQYAGIAITDVDLDNGEADVVFIVEARNKGNADDFLEKLSEAIEDEDDRRFEVLEVGGVDYYYAEAESDWEDDIVMARAGNLLYFGNSQRTIEDFIEVKSRESLGKDKHYETVMDGLPSNRLGAFYLNGEYIMNSYEDMAYFADIYNSQYFEGVEDAGLAGMGFSISVPGDGLRMDFNVAYNEDEMSEFMEQSLDVKYKDPVAAEMVSGDVFLFYGQSVSGKDKVSFEDSPFFNEDVQESLEMFEDEFGISIQELYELGTGEFGFAIGPARDGVISDMAQVDLGGVLIIGVEDEEKAIDLAEDLQGLIVDEFFWYGELDENDIDIAGYEMVEISVDDGYDEYSFITYGADDGYFIAGIGNDLMEAGLEGKETLAKSDAYKDTWKAFPSGSVPVMFIDVDGFIQMMEDVNPYAVEDSSGFNKFKTIGLAVQQPSKTSVGGTLYIFIDL